MKSGAIVYPYQQSCVQFFIGYLSKERRTQSRSIFLTRFIIIRRVMSRNKEKQKNVLNRFYLSKTNPRKFTKLIRCANFLSNLHLAKPRRPHLVSKNSIKYKSAYFLLFSLKFIQSMNSVDGYQSSNEKSKQHQQYVSFNDLY